MKKYVAIFKHIRSEGAGTVTRYLRRKYIPYKIFELYQGISLPPLNEILALVVMGGPMNVDEEDQYPFLATEKKYIYQAITAKIPVLGICLGSQLIAVAFQAKVTRNPQPEVGWFTVDLTKDGENDPIFAGLPPNFPVVQWHHDTFAVPKEAKHLASSPLCRNQAMRIHRYGYALQFHVEVTPALLKSWLRTLPRRKNRTLWLAIKANAFS